MSLLLAMPFDIWFFKTKQQTKKKHFKSKTNQSEAGRSGAAIKMQNTITLKSVVVVDVKTVNSKFQKYITMEHNLFKHRKENTLNEKRKHRHLPTTSCTTSAPSTSCATFETSLSS